jgi:hypothetical protein
MLLAIIDNIPYRHFSCMFYCPRLFTTKRSYYVGITEIKKKQISDIPAAMVKFG